MFNFNLALINNQPNTRKKDEITNKLSQVYREYILENTSGIICVELQ